MPFTPVKFFMMVTPLVLAAPAHAVSVNPRGLGEALIFPYYTVNKGQDTLLSIANTSDVGKAVHVTFHE